MVLRPLRQPPTVCNAAAFWPFQVRTFATPHCVTALPEQTIATSDFNQHDQPASAVHPMLDASPCTKCLIFDKGSWRRLHAIHLGLGGTLGQRAISTFAPSWFPGKKVALGYSSHIRNTISFPGITSSQHIMYFIS